MSKVTETVSPKEMGKINGYTTTLDSLAQIVGPIIGTLLLFDPSLYGLVMGILAFVALMMAFKQIVPYREKVQFKDLEHTA